MQDSVTCAEYTPISEAGTCTFATAHLAQLSVIGKQALCLTRLVLMERLAFDVSIGQMHGRASCNKSSAVCLSRMLQDELVATTPLACC
jgi:hypothetical protein